MKFSLLSKIVTEAANEYKENAAYSGAWNDGGCESLLCKLADYKKSLVVKFDLRPSEYSKLNDIEVGEPKEFSDIIEKYKTKLAKNIKL
jgi:hypothetical protein